MPTLLHLDSSPLETSISRELTREFVTSWKNSHQNGSVVYRDLPASPLKPVDATWIGAAFTPDGGRTPEQEAALAISNQFIEELQSADELVIGVAMHNFSIPAVLKLWIDLVVRSGRTFSYGAGGPQGLLQGKKATVLIAAGGVYDLETPAGALNFVEPYLKAMLGFVGITDVKFVTAGGVTQIMTGAVSREAFLKPTLEIVRSAAV